MLEELISTRKSVRQYSAKEISNETLKTILKAGHLAPSWMNSQSWKFIAVKNDATKELLSKLAMNQAHVKNASAVVAVVADKNQWKKENFKQVLINLGIPEGNIENIFNIPLLYPNSEEKITIRAVEQATIAMSFMLLTAKKLGLESCVIGAISNETTEINPILKESVDKALNLKEGEILVSMLTLGYPTKDEKALNKKENRKNFNEVAFLEKVGQNF